MEIRMKLERRSGDDGGGGSVRDAILDATEAIMIEEGYAAVTSRRVAERAGLKSQLVHYYFGTMDDLFVAVYERVEQEFLQRHLQAATSPNPLRAIWELSIHPKRTRLSQELVALSHHKKAISKITARVMTQMHSVDAAFIARYLDEAGVDRETYPPLVISYMINGLSRLLVTQEAHGVTSGRAEVLAFAERLLNELEAKHRAATGPARAIS
jgi:AcrR family transcriptional regulator